MSRIDREHDQIVQIDVGGEPTALAFGAGSLWVANGESRTVAQVDPGSNRVVQRARRSATRPAASPPASARSGSRRRSTASSAGSTSRTAAVSRSIDIGANPTAIAAGAGAIWVASEESGTVTRLDPRTGAVERGDPRRQRAERRRGRRGRGLGRQPARRRRSRGSTRARTACHGRSRVGAEPGRDRGRRRRRVGGGRQRRHGRCASTPTSRACSSASTSGAAPPPSRSPTARSGRPPSPRRRAIAAARCGSSSGREPERACDRLAARGRLRRAVLPAHLARLRRARRLPAHRRRRRSDARGSAGHGRARAQPRRADLRLHAPPRAALLGRQARAAGGLPRLDRALPAGDAQEAVRAAVLRRASSAPSECTAGSDPLRPLGRDRDRRAGAHDHRPSDPPGRRSSCTSSRSRSRTSCRATPRGAAPAITRRPAPGPTGSPHGTASAAGYTGPQPALPVVVPAGPAGRLRRPHRGQRPSLQHGRARPGADRGQVAEVRRGAADVTVLADAVRVAATRPHASRGARDPRAGAAAQPSPSRSSTTCSSTCAGRRSTTSTSAARSTSPPTGPASPSSRAGADVATPTCQILPTRLPRLRAVLPLHRAPGPGARWSAPDMERARALVAAIRHDRPSASSSPCRSGSETSDATSRRCSAGSATAPRLRVLGETYFPTIYDPGARVQMGFNGWSADYASPSTFIEPNFGCLDVLSQLCDRRLMRELAPGARRRGRRRRPSAGPRSTAASPTSRPPFPSPTGARSEFVSERVGNVQHHLAGYTLLDQLWVR